MSDSKKILKFFIPLTLPKYLKKSNKLFGVVNRTKKNNQLIYEYFIKDSKINHEFVNIANLTKKSNIFELKFTNCELNEQILINFDPQLKSTELKIFKNGKETNTCNDYIIFLYDPGSNFHPHTKTWINSSQNLYARKLEK
ncbi:hypothetical protein BpHYR1_001660 [Brachionus plicatilis]|uniref:Uncharacterized protein n=1 Tax=Brachionus plicatilis TaxID=10195 RepID=A0A3M7P9R3_BRAPC|nr:hypothetical protein BpHYR1_001660 [Brachionus plicatilis]